MHVDTVSPLIPIFRRELELCALTPSETVAILTEGRARLDYADAFSAAAREMGAAVFHVDLPAGDPRSEGELGVRAGVSGLALVETTALEALKRADLVIDLVFLLWSPEQRAIRDAGARIISCIEPPDALLRLFPSPERRARVLEARDLLGGASRIRVSSDAGTDITFEYGDYWLHDQYGYSETPGRWDHFASAMVNTVANDGAANGVVVFDRGDILFPYKRYVAEPTRLEVKDGFVTGVEGGVDAMLIGDYFALFDDERAYQVSHIGWGMDERARWDALASDSSGIGVDARCLYGSVMFSTGPNVEFGGTNDTACHMDMPMRGCSLWLDDRLVIDRGRVVAPEIASAVSART